MTGNQLTTVFMRLRASLRNRAIAILRSDSDSDDALQDAFCRLWTRRKSIKNEQHAVGLSHAAVRSVVIDKLRQSAYRSEPITGIDAMNLCGDDDVDSSDGYEEIDKMLRSCLSSRDYEILRKREMFGYGYDELSEEYGIAPDAVRQIVSRGRRTIREKFINKKNQ